MKFGLFELPVKDVECMPISIFVRRENLVLFENLCSEHQLMPDDLVSAIVDVCIYRFDRLMKEHKKLFEEDSDEA